MGYNSRFSELSWDEIKKLNKFVTKTIKNLNSNNFIIVADPLHCPSTVSLEFTQEAEDYGADMISLIFREKFYSNEQVLAHFKYITDNSSTPILIHEMPFISGLGGHTVNWPVELLNQLADFDNIQAIKEDAKEDEYSKEVISKIRDRLSIVISGGGKRQWMQFAEEGCQNWLNGIGVFEPKLAVNFWKAWENKDRQFCDNLVNDVEVPFFTNLVKKYGWHLSIKAALEIAGHFPRTERLPMLPINDDQFASFKSGFEKIDYKKYLEYNPN
jgi:4-hydroxy-tetrahydrodipicolinate synthase